MKEAGFQQLFERACFLCSCRVPHDTVLNSGKLSLLKWVTGELRCALNFIMNVNISKNIILVQTQILRICKCGSYTWERLTCLSYYIGHFN